MGGSSRRAFLTDVGKGMLVAALGHTAARELGAGSAWAMEGDSRLNFGALERLAGEMADTRIEVLQPLLVGHLRSGTYRLDQLVAAAALANARKFGGEDYVGYHALMALVPALHMAAEMPESARPLPVLKVLYRNTDHIQHMGGRGEDTLKPVQASAEAMDGPTLRRLVRARDMDGAEAAFAALARRDPRETFDSLQWLVQEDIEVHQVVLAHRAWSLLDLVGAEHAHTMLRETVRFCVDAEQRRIQRGRGEPEIRAVLPELMARYNPETRKPRRTADDAWVQGLADRIYTSARKDAAEAAAEALHLGYDPEDVGEAISLAAMRLELCDRTPRVHGACAGVHSSDSAHAWRGIARVTSARHQAASLITAAYHICKGGHFSAPPYPLPEHMARVADTDPAHLLPRLSEAVRANDQGTATAVTARYLREGLPVAPLFAVLRDFAVSEDGRLHAEKFYITARDFYQTGRPSLRHIHLIGLARATASAYGYSVDDAPGVRAPGYEEARRLLQV